MSDSVSPNNERRSICISFHKPIFRLYSKMKDRDSGDFLAPCQVRLREDSAGLPRLTGPNNGYVSYIVIDTLNAKFFRKTSKPFSIDVTTLKPLPNNIFLALILLEAKTWFESSHPISCTDNVVMALRFNAESRQCVKSALAIAGWDIAQTLLIANTTAIALTFAKKSSGYNTSTTLLSIYLNNDYLEVAVFHVTSKTCKCLAIDAVSEIFFGADGANYSEFFKSFWDTFAAMGAALSVDEGAFMDMIQAVAVVTEVYSLSKAELFKRPPVDGFLEPLKAKFSGRISWSQDYLRMGAFPGMARLGLEPELLSNFQERWPWTVKFDLFEEGGSQLLVKPNDVAKDYELTFDAADVPTNELVIYQSLRGESNVAAKLVKVDELKSKCPQASITVSIDADGIVKLKVNTKSSEVNFEARTPVVKCSSTGVCF